MNFVRAAGLKEEYAMKRLKSLLLTLTLVIAAFFSACAKEDALETPTNLAVDVDNNLTWSEISGARTYTVEVTNVSSEEKEEKSVRKPLLDLAFLQTGDYVLRVRANSGKQDSVQSAWSAGLEFHMNYTTGCVYTLINNNSEYEITQVGTSTTGAVTFEDEYRGKPVTSIADGAFRGSSRVTGVVLGANMRSVGKEAFYNCANLETATLNDALTSLGGGAFQNCNALTTVNIPDGITAIEESTFGYCYSLERIEIGKNVQTIGASAFSNCSAMKEITLPDSVVTVAQYAFFGNTEATKLTTGKNLMYIGVQAFGKCSALKTIDFYGADGADKGNLISIDNSAFRECTALREVKIPDTVETLGSYVFATDTALEKIVIPDSVTRVGALLISGTAIARAQEESGYIYADKWLTQITEAKKTELSDKDNKVNLNVAIGNTGAKKTETLPADTRGIAASVFQNCDGVYYVMLPESVKTVGAYAFSNCASLLSVRSVAGGALRLLDSCAFYKSSLLATASFPVDNQTGKIGLQTIGALAFYGTAHNGSNIPATVTRIGQDAFKESSLWTATKNDGKAVVTAGNWAVGFIDGTDVGSVSMEGKKGIADYAFKECDTISDVTDTSDVEYIGRSAFYKSTLRSISLGSKITTIEDYAFYGCQLRTIDLPVNLTSIGRSAFYETQLARVDFSRSNKLETVGAYAFFGATSLERVNFGDTVKEIGAYAFYGCSALDLSLPGSALPDSLEVIGSSAFRKCVNLKEVTFGKGLKEIGSSAFSDSGLISLHLPDGLEKVGSFAFYNNASLKEVTFGKGLKEIGLYAFAEDAALTDITLPEGLETLGTGAFRYCTSLTSATISSTVKDIGLHAFYWCDFLTIYTDAGATDRQWIKFWNSSYRPVVYSCTLSEDKSYVVSIVTGNTEYTTAVGGVSDPARAGYTFGGWATSENATTGEYTTAEAAALPAGTTLYAVWTEQTGEAA